MSYKIVLLLSIFLISSGKIIELDDSNYNTSILSHNISFISIQSASCEKCKSVYKELEEASELLSSKDVHFGVIDVNSTKTQNIVKLFNFDTFPSLFLIRNNRTSAYHAVFKANAIVTFITKLGESQPRNITTLEELNQALDPKINYMSLIIFNRTRSYNYNYVNSLNKFCTFAYCDTEICFKKYNISDNADYMIVRNFELDKSEKKQILFNYTNEDTLLDNVIFYSLPKVSIFSDFAAEIAYKKRINTIFLVKTNKGNDDKNEKELREVLANYTQGQFIGLILHSTKEDEKEILNFFGFDKNDFNKNFIFILSFKGKERGINYLMKQEINLENLAHFIEEYQSGKIYPSPRSEGEPSSHPKENLRIVVAKTFQKEVLQNNKQSIVIAYVNDGCAKCQEVKEIFNKLADKNKNKKDLLFVFIDPIYNDVGKFPNTLTARDLPVIEYYDIDKTAEGIKFKGGFEYEKIEKFVESEGFNEPVVITEDSTEEEEDL